MLIDSHTHIQFPEFDADRDAVIKHALDAGIWMVNVGTNVESSKKAVELAHQYKEGVYATVGIHPVRDEISNGASPHEVDRESQLCVDRNIVEIGFKELEELAKDKKVVGIGETGLDYYRNQEIQNLKIKMQNDNVKLKIIKGKQKELFIKHIELAQKVSKPLIIHCRNAHDDLLEILQVQYGEVQPPTTKESSGRCFIVPSGAEVEPRGVMHFFSGEGAWENLDKYLAMGFYISLAGVITFKNYGHHEDIKRIPLDRILVETDAPYVAPAPYRGKRNEPSYIKFVAEKLAEIKGVSFEEVEKQTSANAKKLFSI